VDSTGELPPTGAAARMLPPASRPNKGGQRRNIWLERGAYGALDTPRDAARPRSDASRPRPACDSARPRPRDVAIGSRLLALRLSRPRFHYCPRRNGGAGSGPSTVMVEGALSVQLWKKAASRSPTQRRPRGGRGRKLFFKQHQLGVFEIYFRETLHLNTSSTIAKWYL
jgi:hypothetical protein